VITVSCPTNVKLQYAFDMYVEALIAWVDMSRGLVKGCIWRGFIGGRFLYSE